MNRITQVFKNKKNNILNIFITAGFPKIDSLEEVVLSLEANGVDMVEIGMPYSDPLADGPVIQNSSQVALGNGMSLELLFQQIKSLRVKSNIALILMGYYNQMLQFGVSEFLQACKLSGVDGLIIPDLPAVVFKKQLKDQIEELDLSISFLICPSTTDDRILEIDELSSGFVYVVSSSAVTGTNNASYGFEKESYFERIKNIEFKNPTLIGFGIHDKQSFEHACSYANGAIIGSAFINALACDKNVDDLKTKIKSFIGSLK